MGPMFRGLLLLAGLASLARGLVVMGPSSSSSSQPRGVVVDDPSSHSEGLTTTSRRAYLGGMLLMAAPLLSSSSAALAFENKISNKYDDRPKRRGPKPSDLGVQKRTTMEGDEYYGLKNCGAAPNCFCSTTTRDEDAEHWIPAWKWPTTIADKTKAFEELYAVLKTYPPGQSGVDGGGFQFQTVDTEKGYIYVIFEALKNGYYDDVEFVALDGADGTVQVRSSSRIGYLDFGVNAKRLNWIAKQLRNIGWDAEGVNLETHQFYKFENEL